MSTPYGHTEDTLPGIEDLTTSRSASPEDVRAAVSDSLGIGAERVRYTPPDGDLPDVSGLRDQLFEED